MSVYLTESKVLVAGGKVAVSDDCCCAQGVCCNYGGVCGTGPSCDDSTNQVDCEAGGGTWIPNVTCADTPCGCLAPDGNPWVSHIKLILTITGAVTLNCSPYSCAASWSCSYSHEEDFNPCVDEDAFVGDSTACITCPEHCHIIDTCNPNCSVSLGVAPRQTGLLFTTPFAVLLCNCEVDLGYATTLGSAYRPVFDGSNLWCGWSQAAGTYNFSDTVSWAVACPSLIGTGSATWNLTVIIS